LPLEEGTFTNYIGLIVPFAVIFDNTKNVLVEELLRNTVFWALSYSLFLVGSALHRPWEGVVETVEEEGKGP